VPSAWASNRTRSEHCGLLRVVHFDQGFVNVTSLSPRQLTMNGLVPSAPDPNTLGVEFGPIRSRHSTID
jgi:hypothetical protein